MTGYRLSIARDPGSTAAAVTRATTLTSTAEDVKPRNKPNVSAARIVRRTNAVFIQGLLAFTRQGVPSYLVLKRQSAALAPPTVAGSAELAISA